MTLRYDDSLMFRDALDLVHGLDPALRATMAARFVEVRAEVTRYTGNGEYGFLKLGQQPDLVARLLAWRDSIRGRFDHLIVLGIGGSALGPKALLNALKRDEPWTPTAAGLRRNSTCAGPRK